MVDIRKTEHQKLADGSEYLVVTIADDLADGRIRDLLRSEDIPELLPFFIVNLKDLTQIWYDISQCHPVGECFDDVRDEIGGILDSTPEIGPRNVLLAPDTVFFDDTPGEEGGLLFVYIPDAAAGEEQSVEGQSSDKDDDKRYYLFFANDDTEGACGIVTKCGPVSHDEAVKRMHDEAKKVITDHLKPASWDPDPVDMDKLGKELDKMGKDDESLRQFISRDIIYCSKDEDNIMLLMQDTWCPSCMWSVKKI